jgi:hypothetical protein
MMKPVQDRKKLRRDYLGKKFGAYVSVTICSLLFVPAILVAVLCGVGALGCTILTLSALFNHPSREFIPVLLGQTLVLLTIGGTAGGFAYLCGHAVGEAAKASNLPYVPPVNANTLPADEILVRGSVEPPATPGEILLRPTQAQETPQEELLRSGQK